jgi:hypothetical protein
MPLLQIIWNPDDDGGPGKVFSRIKLDVADPFE